MRGPAEQVTNVLRTTEGVEHVAAEPASGPQPPQEALAPGREGWLPPHTRALEGTLDGQSVLLDDFAPDCSPATLTIGGRRLPLHFLQDWHPGATSLTGALYADAESAALPLFHGRPLIEVELELELMLAAAADRSMMSAVAVPADATWTPSTAEPS